MRKIKKWFYNVFNTHYKLKKFTVVFEAQTESQRSMRTQPVSMTVREGDVLIPQYVNEFNFRISKVVEKKYKETFQKMADKLLREYRENESDIMLAEGSVAIKGKHIVYVDWCIDIGENDFEPIPYEDYIFYGLDIIRW
jgi:hypothetical protein